MLEHLTLHRPTPIKIINGIGRSLASIGVGNKPLDAEKVFNKAYKKSKSTSQRDYSEIKNRFKILCDSVNVHSRLNTTGKLLTSLSFENSIKIRIEVDDWIEKHPQILERKIEKPIFILGLPRTGTTALFNILNAIEGVRAPLGWEINKPIPPVEYASKDTDPRIKLTHQEFEAFFYLTPNLRFIHDFGALLPQECIAATQYDLYTGQFFFTYEVPEYLDWYQHTSNLESFHFHKRFFQVLQSDFPPQRWLFKSPFHIDSLDELLATYPDAQIIQTHRDPMEVMGSSCSFAWHLRSTFSDDINAIEIGKQQLQFWGSNLNKIVKDRERLSDKAHQFFDVNYQDFVNKPLETVSSILNYLSIPQDKDTSQKLIDHVTRNKKDRHGKHIYFLEDYGLDAARDGQYFEEYCTKFNL